MADETERVLSRCLNTASYCCNLARRFAAVAGVSPHEAEEIEDSATQGHLENWKGYGTRQYLTDPLAELDDHSEPRHELLDAAAQILHDENPVYERPAEGTYHLRAWAVASNLREQVWRLLAMNPGTVEAIDARIIRFVCESWQHRHVNFGAVGQFVEWEWAAAMKLRQTDG